MIAGRGNFIRRKMILGKCRQPFLRFFLFKIIHFFTKFRLKSYPHLRDSDTSGESAISSLTYVPNEIAKFKNPKRQPGWTVLNTACQKIPSKSYEDRIERWPDIIDAVFYVDIFSISDTDFESFYS